MDRNFFNYNRANSYINRYTSRQKRIKSLFHIDQNTVETIANQLIASAIITIILIVISNINTTFTNKITYTAKWIVESNYDFKSAIESGIKSVEQEINKIKGIPASSNKITNDLSSNVLESSNAAYVSASVMIMPVDGEITSNFGIRDNPLNPGNQENHTGIDIAGKEGTPIKAALDGIVEAIEINNSIGRSVKVKHEGGIETLYGHCSEILVDVNQNVKQGDYIAKVGQTGNATAPHLHFEVIKDGKQIDPLSIIGTAIESK